MKPHDPPPEAKLKRYHVASYCLLNHIYVVECDIAKNEWVAVGFRPANASTLAQHKYTTFIYYKEKKVVLLYGINMRMILA